MIATPQKPRAGKTNGAHTAEELIQMSAADRYELVRGELIEMAPPPGWEHGKVTNRLAARAAVYVADHNLGETSAAETGFLLARDPDTVLAPDFAFIARERLAGVSVKTYLPLCPDLVMETVSPSDTRREVALKTDLWLRFGARVVWILDPADQTLTIHRPDVPFAVLTVADTLTGGDVLPGFSIPMADIFRLP